jgi:hypothetical protein
MSERRYAEEEVAAIFRDAAAESQTRLRSSAATQDGLTLSELQVIARDVGLSRDAVAHAAAALDIKSAGAEKRLLGLPIGVGRSAELNRNLTDDEWDRLVVRLRDTFDATGVTRVEGGLRQWSNGNLHVRLEPTADGQRLHLSTVNGAARAYMRPGMMTLVFGAVLVLVSLIGGTDSLIPGLVLSGIGASFVAIGAVRLPRWARLRGEQMDQIAAETATLTSEAR